MKDLAVRLKYAAGIVVLAALAGCAGPTPYRPAEDGFGYAVQPLEANRVRVTFAGNSLTPRETVENYLLYRAAEATLENDYDHFIVTERDTERRTTYETSVVGYGGWPGYWPGYWAGYSCYYCRPGFGAAGLATARTRPRDRYTAYANIVMGKGDKPADRPDAYDARALLARLEPLIERPPQP